MSLINRYLSDSGGAGGSPPSANTTPAQEAGATPPGGAQETVQDTKTGKPTDTPGGTKGTLSDLQPTDQLAENLESLPDWAQKLYKDLRAENAAHRQAKKKAEQDAETAARKAAEEQGKFKELYEQELILREAAEAEARRLELDALRSKVATEVGLPPALASRLQGETEDEIRSDAQEVLAALPKHSFDNDAARGTGGVSGQAPQMSDEEIQEFAARYNVDPRYVKPEFFRIARK